MLITFLFLFIFATFGVLVKIIYDDQVLELMSLTQQEVKEIEVTPTVGGNQNTSNVNERGIYINYFLKASGELIIGDEFNPGLRQIILNRMKEWKTNSITVKYETFDYGNNQEYHFLIAAESVFDKGKFMGTVYFGKDISSLWRMFQWLLVVLLSSSLLFVGIALVIGQFLTTKAMKPILQSYQLQREFLADASHELRTPISILKSGLEIIDMEESKKFSDFTFELLKDLQKEAKSAGKMVSDLLLLARTDSGTQQIAYGTFDFTVMAEQVIRSIQGITCSRHIKLNIKPQGSILMNADQERIKQLLYILLDNAVKYTQDGGEIALSYMVKEIEHAKMLCVIVEDTGIGMEPEHIPYIFNRFYRIDKNRSWESGGTGLGLAIAKWIVEAHRGFIQVSSTSGVGSTFTFYLPLK